MSILERVAVEVGGSRWISAFENAESAMLDDTNSYSALVLSAGENLKNAAGKHMTRFEWKQEKSKIKTKER